MAPDPETNRLFDPTGGDVVVTPGLVIAASLLDYSFARASGPGGQNVNKKSTKCVLRVDLRSLPLRPDQLARLRNQNTHLVTEYGDLLVVCDEHRSAPRNKSECTERLRTMIARCLVAPKIRKPTKPTRGSKERRLGAKRIASDRKRSRRVSDSD